MPIWKVEIASPPDVSTMPDVTSAALDAALIDAEERLLLVEGSTSVSTDGRLGGTNWIIECASAAQAAVLASEILITALVVASLPMSECVVDVLHVARVRGDEDDDAS